MTIERVRTEILTLTRKGQAADVSKLLSGLTAGQLVALADSFAGMLAAAAQLDRGLLEAHIAALAAALPVEQDPHIAALLRERSTARDDGHRTQIDEQLSAHGYSGRR